MTDFSEKITKLRQERGENQREAASGLGISQTLLSMYESGQREPKLDFFKKLCDYYDTSADFLLGREVKNANSEKIETIISKIHELEDIAKSFD